MTSFWKHKYFLTPLALALVSSAILVIASALSGASSFAQTPLTVLSPYTFQDGDGKKYNLYGIHALNKDDDPIKYRDSNNMSVDFINLAPFEIDVINDEPNRYGFYDVILWNKDKTKSLQEAMLEKGLTKIEVYDKTLKAKLFTKWKEAESKAPYDGFFRLKKHKAVEEYKFQIVKDVIREVSERKDFTFINFTTNWKEDFTIMIPKALWKKLDHSKFEVGNTIQIRGFSEEYYGPMIKLTSERQLD